MTTPTDSVYKYHTYKSAVLCGRCGFREDLADSNSKSMHSQPFSDSRDSYAPHRFRPIDECRQCGFEKTNRNVHVQ